MSFLVAMRDDSREPSFDELADNAPVMIWRAGPDKLCDWFNKPWLDFVGRPMERELGCGWTENVHPEDFARRVETYNKAFDARDTFRVSYRLRRQDGAYRYVLDNGQPYVRKEAFAGYFGSCVDITEEYETHGHEKVLRAELQHRVKNNLQLILSFVSLQTSRVKSDEAKAILKDAARRIHVVGAIQDRLAGAANGTTVDLAEYLPPLAKDIVTAETMDRIALVIEVDPFIISLEAASTIGFIINELITNAAKYAFPAGPGELRLSAKTSGDQLEIIVADNGPGFPDTEGRSNSASLGMTLVSALAQKIGAELTRENHGGARATIHVPIGRISKS